MKKFLVVLMLLIVASAYSVGGSMYMRYQANAKDITNKGATSSILDTTGIVASEGWADFLEDLRVGRRGTGFDLNFDSFTLSYKLRSGVASQKGFTANLDNALGSGIVLTSPGYVQLSGLRVGPANM
ncbi:MAG: hypothetical protein N2258_02125, partial [Brevinematales bacterium]|nr:hypothetical protein [Brevinematales bacterium]